jgi:putative phage-type endonuclease
MAALYPTLGTPIEQIEPFTQELHAIVDTMKEDMLAETCILEGTAVPTYDEFREALDEKRPYMSREALAVLEARLAEWLLDNRPYTQLNRRVRQFALFCCSLQPGLRFGLLKRILYPMANRIMLGEAGRRWNRDRCFERVLRLYGDNDQRTDAWHAKRSEMITASEVYQVFGSESARREVMMRKLEPRVQGEGPPIAPLLWGTRFEPVAKKIYEERTRCKIYDVSCVQHPVHSFLGASPDGLIVPNDENDVWRYGRLVEFKCPMSRAPKDEIPPGYVHQMQMQMECTGIDECEYVEFRFKQVNFSEWTKSADTKGHFTVYDSGKVVYDIADHADDAQVIYWILGSIKEGFVRKDPNWLPSHIDGLKSFWNTVLTHRANGTRPEETKKSITLDL